MLGQAYPLRSTSSPPRSRPTRPPFTESSPEITAQSSSSSSSVHTTQHTIQPTTPPNHNNRLSSAVPWSQSAKRKVLRLRRPSSSGSGHPGSRELPPLPIHKSSAPPRPPRNPARVKLASRPSTSSGVPDPSNSRSIPRPHALSDSRVHKSVGDSVSWEFPLPTGSEFPLQRKKSRSSKGSAPSTHNATAKNDAQFSTVDRTILDQLRRKVQAREEQFILRNGKKHHAFSAKEVPYPRSYERHVIDLDVWFTLWIQQVGGSITMHMFEHPPTKVLDIGCGAGTWILDAARQWKNTHFVGLDIVPLHPDLMQIGSLDLASRITWVQANFLEGLPFPNEEFDYVRFTRIARGVPEDKWDDLFEEITRVMKPGTAFELLEEDLYFPGRLRDSASPSPSSGTPRTTPPSTPSRTVRPQPCDFERRSSLSASTTYPEGTSLASPTHQHVSPRIPSQPAPPTNSEPTKKSHLPFRTISRPPSNPHDHSLLETIYNEMHAARFVNLEPLSLLGNTMTVHFKDVRSHPPVIATFPPIPQQLPTGKPSSVHSDPGQACDDTAEWANDEAIPTTDPHSLSPTLTHLDWSSDWIEAKDLVKGTPYFSVDKSRFSAFAPMRRSASLSTAAAFEPHRSPSSPKLPYRPSYQDKRLNSLPNRTVKFDVKSLNLHLSSRVQDVLACAEAMWDYVVDYQMGASPRVPPNSPPPFHQQPTRSDPSPKLAGSASVGADPIKSALMNLTRDEFDALLTRFELDMQDSINLSMVVEDRLAWAPVTPSRTEERKAFDEQCAAWDRYQNVHDREDRSRGSTDTVRPQESHPYADANVASSPPRKDVTSGEYEDSLKGGHGDEDVRASSRLPAIPPSHRLNRSARVFVAWKA